MKTTITIKGLSELEEVLGGFHNEILKPELETSMSRSMFMVERSAVHNVNHAPPEHPQVQTGNLSEHIMSEWYWTSDILQGDCGTNVIYGMFLELGHFQGHGQGRRHSISYLGVEYSTASFVGPYAWLDPALIENVDNIKNEFEDACTRAVNRANIR